LRKRVEECELLGRENSLPGLTWLSQGQGKGLEAYELLAPVYGWFTEGFNTKDLQKAKTLARSAVMPASVKNSRGKDDQPPPRGPEKFAHVRQELGE
jgi:hypothetical protein